MYVKGKQVWVPKTDCPDFKTSWWQQTREGDRLCSRKKCVNAGGECRAEIDVVK